MVLLGRGGLLTSVLSCLSWDLLADAAVGRIMRSRKLPSAGAGFLGGADVPEVRDSGRWLGASDERGVGLAEEVVGVGFGFGFGAAEGLLLAALGRGAGACADSGSCFAREDAVGAVRREGRSIGLVVLGLLVSGLAAVEGLLEVELVRSVLCDLDIDEAVGAVREVRLAFFTGCFCFGPSEGAGACFLVAAGDFEPPVDDLAVGADCVGLGEAFAAVEGAFALAVSFGSGFFADCAALSN